MFILVESLVFWKLGKYSLNPSYMSFTNSEMVSEISEYEWWHKEHFKEIE